MPAARRISRNPPRRSAWSSAMTTVSGRSVGRVEVKHGTVRCDLFVEMVLLALEGLVIAIAGASAPPCGRPRPRTAFAFRAE
jgi:hypothetical protein